MAEATTSTAWEELVGLTIANFESRFPNEAAAIDFCEKYGLIPRKNELQETKCPKCTSVMAIQKNPTMKIGYILQCTKRRCQGPNSEKCYPCRQRKNNCRNRCSTSINPLVGTWFEQSKLPFRTILEVTFLFLQNVSNEFIAIQLKLGSHTVTDWLFFCREICGLAVQKDCNKIGGPGLTVEIDETHLYKRKYNKGRILKSESVWIVGGICRETNECFLEFTTKRNHEILEGIISRRVEDLSFVITDCWGGYSGLMRNLPNLGGHFQVNHKKQLSVTHTIAIEGGQTVDFIVHTNKVERMWRHLKDKVKSVQESVNQKKEEIKFATSYIWKFMYERNFMDKIPQRDTGKRFSNSFFTSRKYIPENREKNQTRTTLRYSN